MARYATPRSVPIDVARRRLVFQRLLARLLRVAPDRWVLSGGAALDWRLAERPGSQRARTTVDLDLLYRATLERARADLEAAGRLDLGDYFTFRVGAVSGGEEQTSVRYHATAFIGSVPYLDFSLDVGVIDPLRLTPEPVVATAIVNAPEFEAITVPALPVPHQLAEKVHALTRTLDDGSRRSRSVKDLADILLMSATEQPDAADVHAALIAVFNAYDTHGLPAALPVTPAAWAGDYRMIAASLGLPEQLAVADAMVAEFMNPVLAGRADGRWDGALRQWSGGGRAVAGERHRRRR